MDKRIESLLEIEKYAQEIVADANEERRILDEKTKAECQRIEQEAKEQAASAIDRIKQESDKSVKESTDKIIKEAKIVADQYESQYRRQREIWKAEIIKNMIGR